MGLTLLDYGLIGLVWLIKRAANTGLKGFLPRDHGFLF